MEGWEVSATILVALWIHWEVNMSCRQGREVLMILSTVRITFWRALCLEAWQFLYQMVMQLVRMLSIVGWRWVE